MQLSFRDEASELSHSGWIGVADSLLCGTVLFLLLAMLMASQVRFAQAEANRSSESIELYERKALIAEEDSKRLGRELSRAKSEMLSYFSLSEKWEQVFGKPFDEYSPIEFETHALRLRESETAREKVIDSATEMQILKQQVASLTQSLSNSAKELATAAQSLNDRRAEVAELQQSVAYLRQREKLLLQNERLLFDVFSFSQVQMQVKNEELARVHAEMNAIQDRYLPAQRRLNNELLGLGGRLEKVVVLVDTSESMRGESYNGDSYWNVTKKTIERWINSLDVDRVAVCFFGDEARIGINMAHLDDDHRKKISALVSKIEPSDKQTDFVSAFKLALRFEEVDTIIIFSDGLPSVDVAGVPISAPRTRSREESEEVFASRFDREMKSNISRVLDVHREVVGLVKSHPGVVVNAIGLGEKVFSERTGNLLNDLSLKSGGVFIAIPGPVE